MYLFRAPKTGLAGWFHLLLTAGDVSAGLTDASWRTRHRVVVTMLIAQAAAILGFAYSAGYGVEHAALEALVPSFAALMAVAARRARTEAAGWSAIGLFASYVVLLHVADGALWTNLFFVAALALLGLYRSWTTVVAGLVTVAVQHLVVGVSDPHSVYGHADPSEVAPLLATFQLGLILVLGAGVLFYASARRARSPRSGLTTAPLP